MFCRADCEQRELQRQMKNDGAQRSPALREGVFPRRRTGAWRNMLAIRRDYSWSGHLKVAPTTECQNVAWPGVRGNGMTSRMLAIPVA